jgi:sorbitol-specific phosphotransferase system component IIBC
VSGTTEKEMNQRKREREKKADEELVASIAEKRKRWVERIGQGVKVTVVLMASREALGESSCVSGK